MTTENTEYKTPAQEAAEIRAALKAKGWGQKHVSVKTHSYSMGSSIYVTIKDPCVNEREATEMAARAEHVRRDGYGDILSGGNRFVTVDHSRECREILARRHADALRDALAALWADKTACHRIGQTDAWLQLDGHLIVARIGTRRPIYMGDSNESSSYRLARELDLHADAQKREAEAGRAAQA